MVARTFFAGDRCRQLQCLSRKCHIEAQVMPIVRKKDYRRLRITCALGWAKLFLSRAQPGQFSYGTSAR